jgi:hypothetical protein
VKWSKPDCPPAGAVGCADAQSRQSVDHIDRLEDRFIKAYDVELQAFINDVQAGQLRPSAWDMLRGVRCC